MKKLIFIMLAIIPAFCYSQRVAVFDKTYDVSVIGTDTVYSSININSEYRSMYEGLLSVRVYALSAVRNCNDLAVEIGGAYFEKPNSYVAYVADDNPYTFADSTEGVGGTYDATKGWWIDHFPDDILLIKITSGSCASGEVRVIIKDLVK